MSAAWRVIPGSSSRSSRIHPAQRLFACVSRMTIPQVFGKGKIKMLRGEEPHEGGRKGRKSSPAQLSFSIEEELGIPLKPAAFNVLYVQTPRIGLLQTPVFRALTETWLETGELVRAALRFGFPETSLRSKCPYYE